MPLKKRGRNYHHGDLRRAILDASVEMIAQSGVDALTLRGAARSTGVSHGAPLFHFADKTALLAAIAGEGFSLLAAEMTKGQSASLDPIARFEACGRSYISFARKHPGHFRAMFRAEFADAARFPELVAASAQAFQVLVEIVLECQASDRAPPGDPMPLVLTAWATAHGLASLWVDGPLSRGVAGLPKRESELAAMATRTLGTLLAAGGSKATPA